MKQFLILVILASSVVCHAQQMKISIEDRSRYLLHSARWDNKEQKGFQDGSNIIQIEANKGNLTQFAYTTHYSNQKHPVILRKVDASGKEILVNKLENGEREFGPVLTQSIEFGGKILLLYTKYINKDTMKLYASVIDKNSLQLTNTTLLHSYAQENVGLLKLAREANREIIFSKSPDHSKLLLALRGEKQNYFTCVLDSTLKVIRQKISPLQGTEGLTIVDIKLENGGSSAFVLSDDNNAVKKILLQRSNGSEKIVELFSQDSETAYYNPRFEESKDHTKLYLFGDYSGKIGRAGTWIAELQPEQSRLGKPNLFPYPEDFKKRVYEIGFGERKRSEYGILSTHYQLTEFADGGLALSGSPFYLYDSRGMTGDGKSVGHAIPFSGPIITAFISGKKESLYTMIPRHQNSCGGSESVFIPFQDKLVVVYNDYEKNINGTFLADDVHQKGGSIVKELSLAYAVIKKDGVVESRKMLSEGISRMNYYNTAACEFVNEKKLVIPSASTDQKSDDLKVAVITLE